MANLNRKYHCYKQSVLSLHASGCFWDLRWQFPCFYSRKDFSSVWYECIAKYLYQIPPFEPDLVHRTGFAFPSEGKEHWAAGIKAWEWCLAIACYFEFSSRLGIAIGFGVGTEPVAIGLAGLLVPVVATDVPFDPALRAYWDEFSLLDCEGLQALKRIYDRYPYIMPWHEFVHRCSYYRLDCNAVPDYLPEAVYHYSCSSLEHIGGFANVETFLERTLPTLHPKGGAALHIVEYGLRGFRLESPTICVYSKADVLRLASLADSLGFKILGIPEQLDEVDSGQKQFDWWMIKYCNDAPIVSLALLFKRKTDENT